MTAYKEIKSCLSMPERFAARQPGGLCENLDEVSLAEARSQVKFAADSGNEPAQMMFALEIMSRESRTCEGVFRKPVGQGLDSCIARARREKTVGAAHGRDRTHGALL